MKSEARVNAENALIESLVAEGAPRDDAILQIGEVTSGETDEEVFARVEDPTKK